MYVSLGKFKISYVLIRETFPWLDVFCFFKGDSFLDIRLEDVRNDHLLLITSSR